MTTRDDDVYLAASLYYLQHETMDAIGRRMGVSRSTVSRLLQTARDQGVVRISLEGRRHDHLGEQLSRRFDVTAHVVPVDEHGTDPQRLTRVARQAAALLDGWMAPGSALGVAWGTTVSEVARHLTPRPVAGVTVVQLNGAASHRTSGIPYAGGIIASFAEAYGASALHFPVPAFFDYAETKRALWRERSVARVVHAQQRADLCVFGVGTFKPPFISHVYAAGYLDATEMRALRADKVVGDVCTVLLREDGTYADVALNDRASGPTPHALARIPRRLCVAAGASRVAPLLGALRARAITDLVVDDATARAVLERSSRTR